MNQPSIMNEVHAVLKSYDQLRALNLELCAACKSALEWMQDNMTEAEILEHMVNGHDADICVLCQLREAINQAKGG